MEALHNQNRKAIATFLLFTFGLSSIFYFLIIHTGKLGSGFGIYVTGLMWCPGLSAIITSRILKRRLSLLGWQLGDPRMLLWSYLIPLIYVLITYLIIWITHWGKFYNSEFVNEVSTSFGFDKLPKIVTIILFFILGGIFYMPSNIWSLR
jgi:hypothetical protein